jgi:hypothetical protein
VSRSACAGFAELRSAYVDGAVADPDRERLLAHLVDCPACRAEVAELRSIRRLLSGTAVQPSAPTELSHRLVSIAGAEAQVPLWSRPFRRTRAGTLPSPRRRMRLRTAAVGAAFGSLLVAAGGLGYAAAPVSTMAVISDPGTEAQAEFSSTIAQFPLTGGSVGAVMLARSGRLSSAGLAQAAEDGYAAPRRLLSVAEARRVMARASTAAGQLSYVGGQVFSASSHGRTVTAQIQVDARKGQGSQLSVYTDKGEQIVSGFIPAATSSRMVDSQVLGLLERNYALSGWTGARVAGRPATVVEASSTGAVAARWWIDDATGLLLRQETYDNSGVMTMAYGFTWVSLDSRQAFLEHLPPRLVVPMTTTTLTLSSAAELNTQGWWCTDQLAGLALVRLRSDRADDPMALHLVYSDGLNTVSVFEQRGRLAGAPAGSEWDPSVSAYVRHGASSLASWQSDALVITVVTDGSARLLATAVNSLPHQAPYKRTTMERVRAGWANIMAHVKR